MLSLAAVLSFQKKILTWYTKHQRNLPWRKTRDPYAILVSEVMLQQTQVSRVIPKYEEWMRRFPTVTALAASSRRDVLSYWSGLGYNRRALYLQQAAQTVVSDYNGIFPSDPKTLEKLPGIGRYTARAIACFAFDVQIPVVDTNIRKVIAVEFFQGNVPSEKTIEAVAHALLPEGRAYEWNQALMDYSSLVLRNEKIPVPKQSHFLTSDRYLRGQTIKLLLQHHSMTKNDLLFQLQKSQAITNDRLEKVLTALEKEGFIVRKKEKLFLSELPAPS